MTPRKGNPGGTLRRIAPVLAVVLGLLSPGILAGCNEEPAHCTRAAEGEFLFGMNPEVLDETVEFTARVTSIQWFATQPPIHQYLLRTDEGKQVEIQLQDIGFSLPVVEGASYGFVIEMTRPGNLVPAAGMKIYDEKGLLFLGVSDWLPNFAIFADGYGDLGADGALQVFHQEGGCDPREKDTAHYRELSNYRLEFLIGSNLRAKLWQGEQARLGRWLIHVHKAVRAEAKQQDFLQNQVSFFIRREDPPQP